MSDFFFLKPGIKPEQTGTAICVTCENIFGVSYSVIKYVFYIENPVFDDVSFDFRGSSISLRETLMSDLTQDCVM